MSERGTEGNVKTLTCTKNREKRKEATGTGICAPGMAVAGRAGMIAHPTPPAAAPWLWTQVVRTESQR